jgi:hypothetical protein
VMSSAVRRREYRAASTCLLCANDEQRRWTMHTRLRVVGAILFSADHGSRNHQRGAQHPLDAKKS